MEKRYDIVDAFIYGMKNMMRTLRELTETKEEIRIVKKGNRITQAMNAIGNWLEEEYVPNILDEKEKEYLAAVIKPFRKDIKYIVKFKRYSDKKEYIYMTMKKDDDYCTLPVFEKGTMYKGMGLNKRYTLEELGL